MLKIRKSAARGRSQLDWLNSRHTFSFADYYDPLQMGFRNLRVLNEDSIAPGKGFASHTHRDMEMLAFVLDGALSHRDALGNGRIIRSGQVQVLSTGSGVEHSEFNSSHEKPLRMLQAWVMPKQKGQEPVYAEWRPSPVEGWQLSVSGEGGQGSIRSHADMRFFTGSWSQNEVAALPVPEGRFGWLHIIEGSVQVAGHVLEMGDGVGFSAGTVEGVHIAAGSRLALFDLA